MAYDQATGAPVGISSGIGQSSAVQSLAYTWDGYGNLEERQDANQSNLYETLTYDDLNRLSTSAVTNSAGNGPGSSFNYDAVGNITTRTIAGTSETYNYDPNHPYAVDTVTSGGSTIYSASYDADGNMTTRNGYQIQWKPSNSPSSMASALGSSTFSYDPDHARYYQSATFNGTTTDTTYVGGLFEVVSTSTGTTEYRHNIVAGGQVIAVHTIDGNGAASTSYLHYDHLGSVDAITDDSGNVIQAMSFDAFGLRRDPSNWDYDLSQNQIATLKNYTDRGYTDQEQLDNLSLVHMNGRVYDPTVGRFISADPGVQDWSYSQSFDRYAYVYDDPMNATDPSGFETDFCKENPGALGCGKGPVGLGPVTVTGTPIPPCDAVCQASPTGGVSIFGGSSLSNFLQFPPSPPPPEPIALGKIKVTAKKPSKNSKLQLTGCVSTGFGAVCINTTFMQDLLLSLVNPLLQQSPPQLHGCIANAHGVYNNLPTTNPDKPGAYGVPETPGGGDIDRTQWVPLGSGLSGAAANSYLGKYRMQISGYALNANGEYTQVFNGVVDNMGPPNSVQNLQTDYPNSVLFELPGGPNLQGVNNMLFVQPSSLPCAHAG